MDLPGPEDLRRISDVSSILKKCWYASICSWVKWPVMMVSSFWPLISANRALVPAQRVGLGLESAIGVNCAIRGSPLWLPVRCSEKLEFRDVEGEEMICVLRKPEDSERIW